MSTTENIELKCLREECKNKTTEDILACHGSRPHDVQVACYKLFEEKMETGPLNGGPVRVGVSGIRVAPGASRSTKARGMMD